MLRHGESQLFASLLGRLHQSDMTEDDLRQCSASIQRQILSDLGFDSNAVAVLQDLLHERTASNSAVSPNRNASLSPDRRYTSEALTRKTAGFSSSFLDSALHQRNPGSVEFAEVEHAVAAEVVRPQLGASLAVEVRSVCAIPPSQVPSSAEKEFRAQRLKSGCQPERLFRFVAKRQVDGVAASCNIFDSFVEGFDTAVSSTGQVIGRSLVTAFSARDLEKFSETHSVVAGVDALVTRPIAMNGEQFREWCSSLSDSAEAHAALQEHGSTCVQVTDDDDFEDDGKHQRFTTTKLVVFDSRITIVRVLAVVSTVRDAFHCAPGAVSARGCSTHNYRKYEFWNSRKMKLFCALCLFSEPEERDNCIVIDEAFSNEIGRCNNFRDRVKNRQNAISGTLSKIDAMQDTLTDRTAQLRDQIENAFLDIRRIVDLQEADIFSVFDMAVKSNAETLAEASELFRRFGGDARSFIDDATGAVQIRDPVRVLGVAQLAAHSDSGGSLDLGSEVQHAKSYELPTCRYDKHAIIAALQKAIALVGGTLGRSDAQQQQQRTKSGGGAGDDDGDFDL